MPEPRTLKRAKAKLAAGDSPSTAAGEFIREEMDHIRDGKHGARSTKQAIAIGLSKARRAGIAVKPGPKASARVKQQAKRELARGTHAPSKTRSRAMAKALKREPHAAASHRVLSAHAHQVARTRGPAARRASARKAARTRAHHH
ncbi:MAG TPA: DUF6496 domain-containing protein [Kofleriaceae bacterium]|jgi:hypothetical protein